jgi:hypothetical protein
MLEQLAPPVRNPIIADGGARLFATALAGASFASIAESRQFPHARHRYLLDIDRPRAS